MSKVEQAIPGTTVTKNSWFRRFSVIPKIVAKGVLWVNPDTDPNDITRRSLAKAWEASEEAARLNADGKVHFRESLPIVEEFGESMFLDWLDGPVAERKNQIAPGSHDTKKGGALDASCDKLCRLVGGVSRMVTAYRRGDWYGVLMAGAATIAAPASAYYRSAGEERGEKFGENGDGFKNEEGLGHRKWFKKVDILGFLGTQLGGNFLTNSATTWGNLGTRIGRIGIYYQDAADTLSFVSAVKTGWVRSKGGQPIELPITSDSEEYEKAVKQLEKIKDDASYRKGWLGCVWAGTALVVAATGVWISLQEKNKKDSQVFKKAA